MRIKTAILKTLAAAHAPRTSLVVRHPLRGTAALIAWRAARKAAPRRLGPAIGFLTVAAAIPFVLGWKAARRASNDGSFDSKPRADGDSVSNDPR